MVNPPGKVTEPPRASYQDRDAIVHVSETVAMQELRWPTPATTTKADLYRPSGRYRQPLDDGVRSAGRARGHHMGVDEREPIGGDGSIAQGDARMATVELLGVPAGAEVTFNSRSTILCFSVHRDAPRARSDRRRRPKLAPGFPRRRFALASGQLQTHFIEVDVSAKAPSETGD